MKTIVERWLDAWLCVVALIGFSLILWLMAEWRELDWTSRMACLTVIILPFHAWEEWRFPGGLHYIYNLMWRSDRPDRYPMNRLSDMWTVFGALVFGCLAVASFGDHPVLATGLFFCCVTEIVAHTVGGVVALRLFRPRGKRTIYNPGFAASYLMFLPMAAAWVYAAATGVVPTTLSDWLWGVAAIIGAALVFIVLPETLLKSRDTPYPFTGRYRYGYFARYVEEG